MSEELKARVERALRKFYCRIHRSLVGTVEVERDLLQEAEELIGDLGDELQLALDRQARLEQEQRRLKNAVRYRDRVIADLRSR